MFNPGDKVIWLYTTPHGWNWTIRVRATVVKVNPKTVTIDAELKNGGTVRRNVKPVKLEASTE